MNISNKSLAIFTANHAKLCGVLDLINVIEEAFSQRGYKVSVVKNLDPTAINIVIDESCNIYGAQCVERFRERNPCAIVIVVLTEFIVKSKIVTTFNAFSLGDKLLAAALEPYIKSIRPDLGQITLTSWLRSILCLPLLPFLGDPKKIFKAKYLLSLKKRAHASVYLHMRYLGMIKQLKLYDGVITVHPRIDTSHLISPQFLGNINPIFNLDSFCEKFLVNKSMGIGMTGKITNYRKKMLNSLYYALKKYGVYSMFQAAHIRNFDSEADGLANNNAYSFHPPQTNNWQYSSPTRIYRAIAVEGSYPILTRKFNQHKIEDLCLVLNSYEPNEIYNLIDKYVNTESAKLEMLEKVKNYNRAAIKENSATIEMIEKLF